MAVLVVPVRLVEFKVVPPRLPEPFVTAVPREPVGFAYPLVLLPTKSGEVFVLRAYPEEADVRCDSIVLRGP